FLLLVQVGPLLRPVIGRTNRTWPVGLVDSYVIESGPAEKAGDQVTDRMVSFAEGNLPSLVPQPELKGSDEFRHWLLFGHGTETQGVEEVTWFHADDQTSGARDSDHFREDPPRVGDMHQ